MLDLGGCRPGVNQSFKDRIQTAHRDVCWYSYRFDSHLIVLKSFYDLLSLLSLTYILSLSLPLCFCFFRLSTGFSLRAPPSFDSVTFHRGTPVAIDFLCLHPSPRPGQSWGTSSWCTSPRWTTSSSPCCWWPRLASASFMPYLAVANAQLRYALMSRPQKSLSTGAQWCVAVNESVCGIIPSLEALLE